MKSGLSKIKICYEKPDDVTLFAMKRISDKIRSNTESLLTLYDIRPLSKVKFYPIKSSEQLRLLKEVYFVKLFSHRGHREEKTAEDTEKTL
jgi:hypothetical protein